MNATPLPVHHATYAQIENMKQALRANGFTITELGNGRFHIVGTHHIVADATYDPAGTLAVTVTNEGFGVTVGAINAALAKALGQ